jgi:hypothetical protein
MLRGTITATARNPSPGTQVYGAATEVTFNGTGITWIGRTGPNFGIAAYSVDGEAVSFVDNYSATVVQQAQIATISGLAPGSHSLKIEVTSNKNSASTDYYQVIDAFLVESGNSSVTGAYVRSAEFEGGPWTCGGGQVSDLSGGHCYGGGSGSTASWNFTGSLVVVYGRPDAEDGFSDVYIDGVYIKTIDWVFGTIDDDLLDAYPIFTWKGAFGNHTITFVATGTTDSTVDTRALLQIDEMMAFP